MMNVFVIELDDSVIGSLEFEDDTRVAVPAVKVMVESMLNFFILNEVSLTILIEVLKGFSQIFELKFLKTLIRI